MKCLNERAREAGWLPAFCKCEKCEAIRKRQNARHTSQDLNVQQLVNDLNEVGLKPIIFE